MRAGLILAIGALGSDPDLALASVTAPIEASQTVQRIDLAAELLHAGSTAADVERLLGHPATATALGNPESGSVALLYTDGPVRTQVVLEGGKVTSIALDIVYIDALPLPARARTIKATILRQGVTNLLGVPSAIERWTEAGLAFERLTFARAEEPEFSVFLVDDLVVDVRLGSEKPPGLVSMLLPVASIAGELAIGLDPQQVDRLLGSSESKVYFRLKGQPVETAIYRGREGKDVVTTTFIGGVLTSFRIWSLDLASMSTG